LLGNATEATKSYTTRVYYEHLKYVDLLLHIYVTLLVFIELCLLYITILSRERVVVVVGCCLEETALGKFMHRAMHINYGHFLLPFIRSTLFDILYPTPPVNPYPSRQHHDLRLREEIVVSAVSDYCIDAERSGRTVVDIIENKICTNQVNARRMTQLEIQPNLNNSTSTE